MIAIIDYGAGNILSVTNALKRVGAEYILTSNADIITNADRIILPGVGDATYAMAQLKSRDLDEIIKGLTRPLLGICLGMQLLCDHTEEGDTKCLSIISSRVRRLVADDSNKTPNIGWCEIDNLKSPLFDSLSCGDFVYYIHSFGAEVNEYTICTSKHSQPFSGAINRDNFYGCQFHPEKSGDVGEKILTNFLKI